MDKEQLIAKLKTINIDKGKIAALENQILLLETEYDLNSIEFGDKVSNSNISNPTEEKAIKISEKREELEKRKKTLELNLKMLLSAISVLPDLERAIIIEHYINNKSAFDIGELFGYSERHINRLKNNGLVLLLQMLNGEL